MPTPSRFDQLYAEGKARRSACPREAQAELPKPRDRAPIALLQESSAGRVPALIPLRYGRMIASPFSFFRGIALLQAADLAQTPYSGEILPICGDAHLMNYGLFASPERNLMFDINDFDETHPGPWEWDVKRLTVSLVLAARELGFAEAQAKKVAEDATLAYQTHMHKLAQMGTLDIWYRRLTLDDMTIATGNNDALQRRLVRVAERARNRTHDRLLPKITEIDNGERRLKDSPPTLFHFQESGSRLPKDDDWLSSADWHESLTPMFKDYRATLKEDRASLFDRFRCLDLAFKVVGVGSVGTRCLVALMEDDYEQPLFLQIKEARASVLERYTSKSKHQHQGKRVVFGQRMMQAASDLFLGWATGPADRHYYVRQLRDMKISAALETFDLATLTAYGEACAWTLARAHAKAGGRSALLAGYLGKGTKFASAIGRYALAYADQVEADYEAFRREVRAGKLPVETPEEQRQSHTP
ncbi:DUF2252 domain-containing protein [Crenobacter sp. SG2305]|uniref:DUF2252 domain-containing protein n=1 Tax=Crenobacter oryzisoli TaxID=3056844 RepID=UPI0025AACF69|nr:DUF2252 domain-containing protein [Crenobacter sp. SG2305]MDN0081150.1 DUF2252 domain-containing protein [Crenobacter sp. SG2305]